MKRIALDLDGVVYQWTATACYLLNHHKGYKFNHLEVDSWDYLEDRVSKKDWDWLWDEGIKLGLFRYGSLYKGAVDGIRSLMKLGEVVVITSRPKRSACDTIAWMAYLNLPFTEFHILGKGSKIAVVPNITVAVDDAPKQVKFYTDAGVPCVVPIHSQNASYVKENKDNKLIYPANGWGDIVLAVEKILNG